MHLLLCEFYDLFSSSNFKKMLEIRESCEGVRLKRERESWRERKRQRESCDLLNRSRSHLFSVALPIKSEPGLPTLVTRQIPFCYTPSPPLLHFISYFCHCRIPSRAGGEAFSTLLRCASANNKSIVAKVKSGSAQARKPLHRHLQLAPFPFLPVPCARPTSCST